MKRNRRQGFTLVEMLVVIGIIAALAGLILPAVLGGQAEAKNAVCKLQLKDLAGAMILHESVRDHYPGYAKTIATEDGTSVPVGWVPQLFRFMGKLQEYRAIIENKPEIRWKKPYDNLICPSANPDIGVELVSTAATPETLIYPFTYALNCGRDDANSSTPDDRNTAIGHDHTVATSEQVKVSIDDLVDGMPHTILMTENADLANWTNLGVNKEFMQGVIFVETDVNATNVPFNEPRTAWTDTLEAKNARPWSYHPGGFNVAYADGHAASFQIDETNPHISYRLYRAQMTPDCGDHETDETWTCGSSGPSAGP